MLACTGSRTCPGLGQSLPGDTCLQVLRRLVPCICIVVACALAQALHEPCLLSACRSAGQPDQPAPPAAPDALHAGHAGQPTAASQPTAAHPPRAASCQFSAHPAARSRPADSAAVRGCQAGGCAAADQCQWRAVRVHATIAQRLWAAAAGYSAQRPAQHDAQRATVPAQWASALR